MGSKGRVAQKMSSAVEQSPLASRLGPDTSEAVGRRLGDVAWLAALRAEAASVSGEMAMPNSRQQRPWKYFDVATVSLEEFEPGMGATGSAAAIMKSLPAAGSGVVIQENGETLVAESRVKGLVLTDFADARSSQSQAVRRHLASLIPLGRSKLTALHYAFLRGGIFVEAAANVELATPVRIVRTLVSGNQLATPHTLIVTGANSRVSVIEDYTSGDGEIVALPVVEIVPGPGSEVRYTALHRWGENTRVFSEQRTLTERDSELVGLSVVTGGRVVKSHIEASLEGRGSSSELYGLCLGKDQQHIDFYTLQDHIGADTRSDLLFKSALRGSSRSVYYGLTRVGLGARNANANQEDRNLLLSRTAKADSDPVLEILTNDVIRVSHGATAGPVDEEQLYYLQARGIERPAAEALLVRGYVNQVLDRLPDEQLRAEIEALVETQLEGTA
jgi:Fe-S cluster assembly protein SufD